MSLQRPNEPAGPKLDMALAVLSATLPKGTIVSCATIAEAAGVDEETVRTLEKRTLTKVRRELRKLGVTSADCAAFESSLECPYIVSGVSTYQPES